MFVVGHSPKCVPFSGRVRKVVLRVVLRGLDGWAPSRSNVRTMLSHSSGQQASCRKRQASVACISTRVEVNGRSVPPVKASAQIEQEEA